MSDMQSKQRQQMMQDAIDGQLSAQLTEQLRMMMNDDADVAREYSQLQQVDMLLKRASHRRAPSRLAATIMARVAQRVEAQTHLQTMPRDVQQIMMMSMMTAMTSMMPMMEVASWLVLNAHRDPAILGDIMLETIGLMSLMTDAMVILLEDAEQLAKTNPDMARATVALTSYLMGTILDYIEDSLVVTEH